MTSSYQLVFIIPPFVKLMLQTQTFCSCCDVFFSGSQAKLCYPIKQSSGIRHAVAYQELTWHCRTIAQHDWVYRFCPKFINEKDVGYLLVPSPNLAKCYLKIMKITVLFCVCTRCFLQVFNVVSDTRYELGKKLCECVCCLEIVLICLLRCLSMVGIFPSCSCVCWDMAVCPHSEFDSPKPFFLSVQGFFPR